MNTMNPSIKEKVYGALFGYAVGDALGLGTEFMTKKEIKIKYPDGLRHYGSIVRDAHRSLWKRGECTNDTTLVRILLESICDVGHFDYMDYARRLREWFLSEPIDLVTNMRWVLSQDDYVKDPIGVAERVWKVMDLNENPSDALGKSLFIGLWDDDVLNNASNVCRITHSQKRCRVASEIIATMANSLMWRNQEASFDTLVKIAKDSDPDTLRYLEIARYGAVSDFTLDHETSFWYVRKAMGCSLWSLWHCKSPDEALLTIVNQGGDSDTNAALATGLVALKYGYSAIGKEYIDNLLDRESLDALASRFAETLACRFAGKQGLPR